MRQAVVEAIKRLGLTGYGVSSELPYDSSGTSLYIKNPKRVYVDNEQSNEEPLFLTMGSLSADVFNTTTAVTVFIAVDAKNKPANYDTTLRQLRDMKNDIVWEGSTSRTVNIEQLFEGDLLISELTYEFTRIT